MKKVIIVAFFNIMAITSICGTIYSELGTAVFWKTILPILVIFSTNLGANLGTIELLRKNKEEEKEEA